MKRILSVFSVIAAMILATSAFAETSQPRLEGKVESIGPRNQRVMVYRYVYDTSPHALTGEGNSRAATGLKMVPNLQNVGPRGRTIVYRWVTKN